LSGVGWIQIWREHAYAPIEGHRDWIALDCGLGSVYGKRPDVVSDAEHVILYSFTNESNGIYPYGGLAISESGVLYGTLSGGGEHNSGTVFSLNPVSGGAAWKEKVLHKFRAGPGGGEPYTDVVVGPGGALYGTTAFGGQRSCSDGHGGPIGCGTVFSLSRPTSAGGAWVGTVLYAFQGGADGSNPIHAGLVLGRDGVLYGTTTSGGGGDCVQGGLAAAVARCTL
jgi:hypothetical protein